MDCIEADTLTRTPENSGIHLDSVRTDFQVISSYRGEVTYTGDNRLLQGLSSRRISIFEGIFEPPGLGAVPGCRKSSK